MRRTRRLTAQILTVVAVLATTFVVSVASPLSPAGAQTCDDAFEVTDGNGNPVSSLGRVFLTDDGTPSVVVDLEARKIQNTETYYVDADAAPGGDGATRGRAFDDIDTAIAAIEAGPAARATLIVAPGIYTWGDIGVPGFSMNVIGAGIRQTIVRHVDGNDYAAQVRANDIYIEGVSFEGGFTALDLRNMNHVTLVDTELYGATASNGVAIYNVDTVVVSGSRAHANNADGFNYHTPLQPDMEVLEIFSDGSDNGVNDLWNSQGSTAHETVKIVRVGGTYLRNPTNISDVGSGESWNIGITTADARADTQGGEYLNYNITGSVRGWIIGGSHSAGVNTPTVVHSRESSQLRYSSRFGTLDGATITGNAAVVDDSTVVPYTCPPPPPPQVQTTCPDVMRMGKLRAGINGTERATGKGFLMWSQRNVQRRFDDPKPVRRNAAKLIIVVHDGDQWLYDNGRRLTPFTPARNDCLVARLNLTRDKARVLRRVDRRIEGIDAGFSRGRFRVIPNRWNGRFNADEWSVIARRAIRK